MFIVIDQPVRYVNCFGMHAQKPSGGKVSLPVVELEARPPVGCPQQSLQSTSKIYKHVAHQEEPEEVKQMEELIPAN